MNRDFCFTTRHLNSLKIAPNFLSLFTALPDVIILFLNSGKHVYIIYLRSEPFRKKPTDREHNINLVGFFCEHIFYATYSCIPTGTMCIKNSQKSASPHGVVLLIIIVRKSGMKPRISELN